MTNFKSDFMQVMEERGFLKDCTDNDALDALLSEEKPVVGYIGFDCTAKSLHVGSLVQIMMLRWLQKSGHKPIVLMGGATTKIGDPSGKDESRKMLTDGDIQENMDSLKTVFSKYLEFGDGPTDAIMVNNDDWLKNINYLDFLRDYGKHFSVNKMLGRESVKMRLEREQHLSFLEFNYMILQAYDFVELNKQYGCRLQLCGSDQWGNVVGGIELNRKVGGEELYGLTTDLITTASGAKMGKSEDGAVWLNADMRSPYDFWQFWRNTEDADVGKFLRLFTELPIEEIEEYEKFEGAEINKAKIELANATTAMCHGEQASKEAEETAQKTFEEGGVGDSLPVFEVDKSKLEAGIPAFMLFKDADLEQSGGAARRLIKGGGAKINDVKVESDEQPVTANDLNDEGIIKLSAGKKRHALVKAV